MIIENNILAISKCLFQERSNWKFVTDQQKEQFFFIFNRYFSKKFPNLSQLLNDKNIDKVNGMDLWFHFMEGKPYPKWFWSKSESTKTDQLLDKDFKFISQRYDLKEDELNFLIKHFNDEVKEELKYLKETLK